MEPTPSIIVDEPLQAFFYDRVHQESEQLKPPLSAGTLHYLTQLLMQFTHSHRFFQDSDQPTTLPTLALLYKDALHAKSTHERNTTLRYLGDCALFISALFSDFFSRKGIGKDYFIGMGGGAYSALADYEFGDPEVFTELAECFPTISQITATACGHDMRYGADDILTLLDRWRQSPSDILGQQLSGLGVVPLNQPTRRDH